jgi:hypothetical protein
MISRWVRCPVVLVVALLIGCGDDGTGPGSNDDTDPPSNGGIGPTVGFETLLGPYAGIIDSESQGITYTADLTVVFQQSGHSISGSFSIDGTLSLGDLSDAIRGTGSFTGTINRGYDPAVDLTFVNSCPGYSAHFSGALGSETTLLTIRGPVHILVDCQVFLTFQTTILMDRLVLPEHEAVAVSSEPQG